MKTFVRRSSLIALSCLLSASSLFAQAVAAPPASDVVARLKALPHVVDVQPARTNATLFKEAYDVSFQQPLDHANPSSPVFVQHVFVSHNGYDKPVLLGTEGYSARGTSGNELQRMLAGNQVVVEHRFFGRSVPTPLAWEFMTIKQSADDLHAVVSTLKALYPGKWVSSGVSKGGQTSLFFKSYYPDDVDATVAYVAPMNLAQEDPRVNVFMDNVGDEASRKKVTDFQITMFKREEELLPLVKTQADSRHWTFGIGFPEAYEYAVLEYPYAFWQYGTSPADIPAPDAPAEALLAHFNKVNSLYYYADQGKKQFEPFMYQAFTEIGYYNYDISAFKPFMKRLKQPTNLVLCPDGAKIVYNAATMAFVYDFLRYRANHVIYIYGELDSWSATQMQLLGRTDAVKFVVKGAHHEASVAKMSPEQKASFYEALERWLGQKVNRVS